MTFYPTPDTPPIFDAGKELTTRVNQAGGNAEKMIQAWMTAFSAFWMTPLDYGERAFSKEQVQEMLLVDKAVVLELFSDSYNFGEFVKNAHPEKIGDDGQLIPSRYFITPYDVDQSTMQIIGDLKPEWESEENAE